MNIEIYSVKKGKSDKEFKENLPVLITRLNRRNMHVLNNVSIDNDAESLLKAVIESEKSQDDIDTVIVLNSYDGSKSSTVHNTLCQLCSCDYTPAKKRISELESSGESDESTTASQPVQSGQSRANAFSIGDVGKEQEAFCFFYKNLRIVTLPAESLTGVDTAEMIKEAIDSAALRTALPHDTVDELGLEFTIAPMESGKW